MVWIQYGVQNLNINKAPDVNEAAADSITNFGEIIIACLTNLYANHTKHGKYLKSLQKQQ